MMRNRQYAVRSILWKAYLARVGCQQCGLKDHRFLEWNHRDPSQKKYVVARIYHHRISRVLTEVRKCDVLCTACHKEVTREQKTNKE
jgi:hypothetical protein